MAVDVRNASSELTQPRMYCLQPILRFIGLGLRETNDLTGVYA